MTHGLNRIWSLGLALLLQTPLVGCAQQRDAVDGWPPLRKTTAAQHNDAGALSSVRLYFEEVGEVGSENTDESRKPNTPLLLESSLLLCAHPSEAQNTESESGPTLRPSNPDDVLPQASRLSADGMEDPLPPLAEELQLHGGSRLYEAAGTQHSLSPAIIGAP